MKNINFVYFGNADAPNGAAIFFRSLIDNEQQFNISDVNCKFYALFNSAVNDKSNEKSSISVAFDFIRTLFLKLRKSSYVVSILYYYLAYIRNAKRVISKIETIKPDDIWLFNDMFSAFSFCRKFPEARNMSIVLHNDGVPSKMLFNGAKYPKVFRDHIERVIKKMLQRMNNIIFLSEDSIDRFDLYYQQDIIEAKKHAINNGVRLPHATRSRISNDITVKGVMVGTICKRKGHDILVDAISCLAQSSLCQNMHIDCLGEIMDEQIVKIAQGRGVNIDFVGPKNRHELAQYLADADFFILCSRDEGMPISIIEAMQYKLPIFATNVGSIPQMINANEGIIFNPNKDEVMRILSNISSNQYDLIEMGEQSYKSYQAKYSIDDMISKYITALTK